MFQLRDYQEKAIEGNLAVFDAGKRSPLNVIFTGGGKTSLYLAMIDRLFDEQRVRRAMILAHTRDLIEQPVDRIRAQFPHLLADLGVVMAERNQVSAKLIVGTSQSITSEKRLNAIMEHGQIDLVVLDECHHADNPTNIGIRERLNPLYYAGFTATPHAKMGHIFDSNPVKLALDEAIRRGYACPIKWLSVKTGVKLGNVGMYTNADGEKDFVAKNLIDAIETRNFFEIIGETHRKYAAGRRGFVFTVSVAGAYECAEVLNEMGIRAVAADGKTSPSERKKILKGFAAGEFDLLVSCMLFTEGIDLPAADVVHMARPTNSSILYTQAIGRGTRIYPGKQDCLILEYAPIDNINICFVGDILGLPVSRAAVMKDEDDEEVLGGMSYDSGGAKYADGNPAEIITQQLDRLRTSPFTWHGKGNSWLVLPCGTGEDGVTRTYLITPPDADDLALYAYIERKDKAGNQSHRVSLVMQGDDYTELVQRAEQGAMQYGDPKISGKKERWKKEPPSDAQMAKLGFLYKDGMTKGELSNAFGAYRAFRALGANGVITPVQLKELERGLKN